MEVVVKLYGQPTSPYQYIKHSLLTFQQQHPIQLIIREVNDIESIIAAGIRSIPAIAISEQVITYNTADKQSIHSFIKQALSTILKNTNYLEMKKILVPTDFSDSSVNACRYARSLAPSLDARIRVVHVDHPTPVVIDGMIAASYYHEDEKKAKLEALIKPLTEDPNDQLIDTPIESEYVPGLASDTLVEISSDYDLIIMGTSGESNLLTQWLGSVSRDVMRQAHCPVWVIPPTFDFQPIRSIIMGYTPTMSDNEYLHQAAKWASKLNAHLHIVHVSINELSVDPLQHLEQFIMHQLPDLKFTCRTITSDNVEEGILHVAKEVDASLIMLARQEKTLWQYLTKGHHSNRMIALANLPVVILHEEVRKCKCGGACKKPENSKCDH